MSFQAKSPIALGQQLKVQELCVRSTDTGLYNANSGNGKISVGEDVAEVLCVIVHDNSVPGVISFAQSAFTISGGDITVASLALAANDVAIVKYIVAE